jgi:hypothetical protein
MDDLGQVAYEAYCESVGGVSKFTGDKLPTWEEQLEKNPQIALAWKACAEAVVVALQRLS